MAWAVVAGAAIGAVGSYVSAKSSNSAAAKASKGAGQVDVTTTRQGDPNADPYRALGMQQAAYAAYGYDPASGDHYTPTNQAAQPADTGDPRQAWRQQRRGAAKAPAGSSSTPATPTPKPFAGMSDQTDQIRTQMMGLPDKNAGMNRVSQDYLTGTLKGQEQNIYRGSAAEAAQNVSNQQLTGNQAYQAALMKALGIDPNGGGGGSSGGFSEGGSGNGGGSGGAYVQRGYSGAGGAAGGGYGSSATGTDAALKALVAGGKPAGWDEMQQNISDQVDARNAQTMRDLKAQGVGSGNYGSDYYTQLAQGAVAQGDRQLADSLSAARFGAYQNALQYGTQYDLGMADVAARNAATSAGAGAAYQANQNAYTLGLYGQLGNSVGMAQQGLQGTASDLGNLSSGFSSDQQNAAAGVNALAGSRRSDLAAAGDLSLGSDNARNSYISSQNQLKASLANTNMQRGVANAQLGWQQQQFYDPLNRTLAYGNALGLFYGGLGSETTQGLDRRSQSPAPFTNAAGAGLQGAALGAQVGSLYQNYGGTSQPASNPAPSYTNGGNYVYNGGVNPYG